MLTKKGMIHELAMLSPGSQREGNDDRPGAASRRTIDCENIATKKRLSSTGGHGDSCIMMRIPVTKSHEEDA